MRVDSKNKLCPQQGYNSYLEEPNMFVHDQNQNKFDAYRLVKITGYNLLL